MFDRLIGEKTAQVSIVSGVLFFIIGSSSAFKFVEELLKKTLNVSLKGTSLLLLHSVLFAVLVAVLTYHVFRPLLGWNGLEGQACASGFKKDSNDECVPDMGGGPDDSGGSSVGSSCTVNADCRSGLPSDMSDDDKKKHYCDGLTCQKMP